MEKARDRENRLEELIALMRDGDRSAPQELLPIIYNEMRAIAHGRLRSARSPTMHTTALVHEAFLRVFGSTSPSVANRRELLAVTSLAMQNILIDHRRAKGRLKRAGDRRRVPLELAGSLVFDEKGPNDALLAVGEALQAFEKLDKRRAEVVKLRVLIGLTHHETAEVLGVSRATVERDWLFARAWLYDHVTDGE